MRPVKIPPTPAQVLAKARAAAARDKLEAALAQQLMAYKIRFVRQYRFDPERRWSADFAMVHGSMNLIVEVQGGLYTGGRHVRGAALEDEYEKLAHAMMHGWQVLLVTGKQIKSGQAIRWIRSILCIDDDEAQRLQAPRAAQPA